VECTPTACTAFAFGKYYFLNDSASADSPQEYAIVDNTTLDQIDEVTFSWMTVPGAWEYLENLLDGNYDHGPSLGKLDGRQLHTKDQHGRCRACN
jgi:hypothetical protein